MKARSQRVLLCLSLSLAASELLAQQPDAGAVYDQAAAAFERKDYRAAARGFAEADAIAPNPVALDSALKAVLLADDPVLGMELATRAESRKASLALAKDARAKFAGRTGELTIRCPDDPNCDVEIDRKPVRPGQRSWVLAGTRVVDVIVLGDKARHQLDVGPGASVEFAAPALNEMRSLKGSFCTPTWTSITPPVPLSKS